jgi:hypothetical protein
METRPKYHTLERPALMTNFLRDVIRDHIHLVAIYPDGPIEGRWFGTDHAAAYAYADQMSAKGYGIYYTVNAVRDGVHKKSTKADIAFVRFAHTDIDPPKDGSPWDKGEALADLMLRGAPSVIVDSGNGWQALWRLAHEPSDVEQVNRGIDAAFGADDCSNKDRILRLPGYTNYPNAKKRSMGRVAAMSELMDANDAVYDPDALLAHWPAPVKASKYGSDEAHVEDESLVLGVDDLVPEPSDRLRDLLLSSSDDRSKLCAEIMVAMGRAGYSNDQMFGVCMNPEFQWAGTCLDQADPARQARRKVKLGEVLRWDPNEIFADDEPRATPPRLEPPSVTRARTFGYGLRDGGIMHIDQQFEHFKGCIYVSSLDRVLMPDGSELNQSRFDNIMGGYSFVFTDEGKVTKSAWEALLKNQRYSAPWAHHVCFRPELPPLTMTEDGTWVLVNTFIPIDTPTLDADPTPFLNHMVKLFPDERDRAIVLNFMASVVQNPGFKAQWWPVIQGAKGNGKTLLLNIMAFAVGEQYSHLPNTGKMTRSGINFNGWMKGKLFLGIDEIYSANRRDFLEEFKPYVTNRRLPIESKGVDEYTGDNRANGIMLTNHQDGVPIDKDERRYAPLFTAQQTAEDCIRDGLTSAYFQDLWAWFRGEGRYAAHGADYGFRIVNHYLRTFKTDPQLDPAQFATRAPRTSSTEQAILAGRGKVEQEILEAIDQGQPGFAGGWISSIMLYKMFDAKRISFPRNKCRDMLKHLGYIPHPGLADGRTNDMVQPDSGKPRLFVLTDHPSLNYTASEIAKKYTEDQITQILGA